jgi:hypothetical protein
LPPRRSALITVVLGDLLGRRVTVRRVSARSTLPKDEARRRDIEWVRRLEHEIAGDAGGPIATLPRRSDRMLWLGATAA